MLDLLHTIYMGRKRPFKFQTCWLTDPTFPTIVSHAWRQHNLLKGAIENFSKEALIWNKEHFGNIFAKKKRIKARLNGIQKVVGVRPSSFLLELEKELLGELDTILRQEEELWALKSRVNWLIQGDRNTAFYHVSTLVRRKRNKISSIKDRMGEWLHDENEVKEFIREGFSSIYTTSLLSASCLNPTILSWQAKLSKEEKESISGEVT